MHPRCCLGPHDQIIGVGDDNHMLFQQEDNLPLWMTPQERLAKKFSQYDELQLEDNTKDELLGNLRNAGVYISVVSGKRVGDLQDIYHKNLISVTNIIRK